MGGKGGGGNDNNTVAYNNAYNAAISGQPMATAMANQPGYEDVTQQAYAAAGQQGGGLSYPGLIFPSSPSGMFGDMDLYGDSGGGGSDMPSYEQQMADQQAALAAQEAERQRIEGENQRDSLYSNYLDAASSATDYINKEISNEISNAQLLGIDYSITDEQKSQRISDYFATVWGEGQQNQLEALMGEWGNPKGFTDWTVTRGDASVYGAPDEGGEETVGAGRGQKPKTILEEEDEDLLGGTATVLGGA